VWQWVLVLLLVVGKALICPVNVSVKTRRYLMCLIGGLTQVSDLLLDGWEKEGEYLIGGKFWSICCKRMRFSLVFCGS
jgi:hypothetical protein